MTKMLYLEDSYKKEVIAEVVDVQSDEKQTQIILNATIFYPQGGGQPADTGKIIGKNGTLVVTHVSYNSGLIAHKGKIEGDIQIGDSVTLLIDWDRRYKHMNIHTAGHIIDQAVKNCTPDNFGVDGDHGISKRNQIVLKKPLVSELLKKIEAEANSIIQQNLPITSEMVSAQEIEKRGIPLQFELPKNKELRIVTIGNYLPMPDGGTHLKTTGECLAIQITPVDSETTNAVFYSVEMPELSKKMPERELEKVSAVNSIDLKELSEKSAALLVELKNEQQIDTATLQTKYLGKKGAFNELAKIIGAISPQDRKTAGQLLNDCKQAILTVLAEREAAQQQTQAWVDLTAPPKPLSVGHVHPVSQAMEEITHIFEKIGFERARYPEVDWDWYVFESLNMPPNHPARDEWETFFVDLPDTTDASVAYNSSKPRDRHPDLIGGKVVLTTHTSNGQVREMERLESKPPIRMINIARCYRRQQDATHTQMFHQFEGLAVDTGITIQHLKGTLDHFAKEFYGPDTKSRIRPFHFQFTEPSFEVDFSCHLCHGTGLIEGEKCKFCKSGWHEVGGAGMVHPNVLRAGGIDPDVYTGFAFGWGIERTYTLKKGLNIDDIRLLYSGDISFLQQF